MRICYLVAEIPIADHSNLASIRYRAVIPGKYLQSKGHTIAYKTVMDAFDIADHDVYIIGKMFDPITIKLLDVIKQNDKKIIADFCDDHFKNTQLAPMYYAILEDADTVVAATELMKTTITDKLASPKRVEVIGDPYEGQYGVYKANMDQNDSEVNLLWFGHGANIRPLLRIMPELNRVYERHPIKLVGMTSKYAQDAIVAVAKNVRYPVGTIDWSLRGLTNLLQSTQLVLLPTETDNRFQVKSANRLIESLWAGVPVWAQATPAYNEFKEFVSIDNDTYPGVCRALARNDQEDIVRDGQIYIAANYSPAVIGKKWEAVL